MSTDSQAGDSKLEPPADSTAEAISTCAVCGVILSVVCGNQFCPVCMLRLALPNRVESGECYSDQTDPIKHEAERFENYELILNKEGEPLELGRGAMGVTYKAFDVDLQCHVSLKVINEMY